MNALAKDYGGVAAMCKRLDLAESSYYHAGPGRVDEASDKRLLRALIQVAGRWPTRGYRWLTRRVRKQRAWRDVNSKRVRRLLKTAGITAKTKHVKLFTTNSKHGFRRYPNLVRDWSVVDHPDQVWAADITYIVLATGEIVYLAVVMDVFTRVIRGWQLGTDLSHELAVGALQTALDQGRVCAIHHSDQGIQYAAPSYIRLLEQRAIAISMSDRGAAWQNGYVERWMRTLKEEEVYLTEYDSVKQANRDIGKFIDIVYNRKREHSALGGLTPKAFEARWRAEHAPKSPP